MVIFIVGIPRYVFFFLIKKGLAGIGQSVDHRCILSCSQATFPAWKLRFHYSLSIHSDSKQPQISTSLSWIQNKRILKDVTFIYQNSCHLETINALLLPSISSCTSMQIEVNFGNSSNMRFNNVLVRSLLKLCLKSQKLSHHPHSFTR